MSQATGHTILTFFCNMSQERDLDKISFILRLKLKQQWDESQWVFECKWLCLCECVWVTMSGCVSDCVGVTSCLYESVCGCGCLSLYQVCVSLILCLRECVSVHSLSMWMSVSLCAGVWGFESVTVRELLSVWLLHLDLYSPGVRSYKPLKT